MVQQPSINQNKENLKIEVTVTIEEEKKIIMAMMMIEMMMIEMMMTMRRRTIRIRTMRTGWRAVGWECVSRSWSRS